MTLFIKYYITEVWPVAGTYFPTQNIKPGMYLQPGRSQILDFLPKIWSRACTCNRPWDLTACRYLFSNPKYEAKHVPEAWPVAGILLPTQNIRCNVYLPLVPVFPPKIWSATCTSGMAGCKYLFLHPKYEAQDVPVVHLVGGTCFPT